jgi:hypothetical protein
MIDTCREEKFRETVVTVIDKRWPPFSTSVDISVLPEQQTMEKVTIHSRLIENQVAVEWTIGNIETYQSRVVGAAIESPCFSHSRSPSVRWQLSLRIRDNVSSSLCLICHTSSQRPQVHAVYQFGIFNVTSGRFEYEERGRALIDRGTGPSLLFDWKQLMEKSTQIFKDGQLSIACTISFVDQQDLLRGP